MIAIIIYALGVLLFTLDNATGGIFSKRKANWINNPYFYVYRVFRIITGYFVYEKIALTGRQNGVDQLSKVIFSFFFIYFIFEVTAGVNEAANSDIKQSVSLSTVYLSEHTRKGPLADIAIDHREFEKMPIKLFVPLTTSIRQNIEIVCEIDTRTLVDEDCAMKFFTIKIDDQVQTLDRAYEEHPQGETLGISCYIDQPELARGQHNLILEMLFAEEPVNTTIKFWYYPDYKLT